MQFSADNSGQSTSRKRTKNTPIRKLTARALAVTLAFFCAVNILALQPPARTTRTEESGGVVQYHHHRITVLDRGDGTSLYRDEIEGSVGWLTPIAGPIVRAMYAARHRKRKAALGLPS